MAYPKLKITPEVQKAFSDVISYAEKKHYRKDLIFNDDFSKEAFEQYLKLVSPDKELFTEAQVAAMKPLSLMLDDAMKDRNPEVAIELLHRSMGAIEKEIAYKKSQALQLDASRLRASIKAGKALSEKPFTDKEFKDLQWPKNETEQQSKWQEEIDTAIFEYSQQEYTLEETRAALIDSQNNIGKKIDSTTTLDALANLLNSIFKLYDPHTAYLPPASKKEFDTEMSLSFFGIGAKLERKKRYVTISEVLPSGAAAKEGSLKKGDRIVGIQTSETDENKNVIGWTTNDVTNLIRGPQHTPVWVSVIGEHESDMAQPRVIQIIRDKVEIEDESASLHFFQTEYQGRLENIAVLRIPSFYADFQAIRRGDPNPKRVATDVFNLLMEVHKKRVMRLIIDLRNNGGGSLGDVLAMASFFIPEGPLLYTKDSKGTVEAYHDFGW
ncbi:MAG: PDZ domain-containing protein [Bdellovibrionales bacterium]|nr:PDZ domain-containing protein [Bdellovibrionales bacterium]